MKGQIEHIEFEKSQTSFPLKQLNHHRNVVKVYFTGRILFLSGLSLMIESNKAVNY